ncbi:hypothetical protein M408DRAFT_310067 [Serendipita vermifera MAFF 305830]|uniref:Uncharacterized protein n=1 Tax=Serendipita vermifera MAFF 305830 TaxID=933852 RepID=A0A0C3BNH0_SERVB|nr:hypothetical protein M408DRAFT_310067 [Serendipita vermifera MAFF 305830]
MSVPTASPWRQFNFFQSTPVKDAHDLGSPPEIFKNIADIACIAPSSQGLLVADIHGTIHLLDAEFEDKATWTAHENGHVTHMDEKRGILITLIEEVGVRYPIIKVWDLEHTSKTSGTPPLLRSAKIQHGAAPHPVSCIALSSGLSHLAIGLGDGTVLFMRGIDQYLFSSSNQQLHHLPKPKTIHQGVSTDSVTGLGFREPCASEAPEDAGSENLYLFIVTLSQTFSYQVTGKGTGYPPVVVDELGAENGCAAMNTKATDMILAREEAIYLENIDGRGSSSALEGPKTSMLVHKSYVVIVSPPFVPSAASASGTVRRFVASGKSGNVVAGSGGAGDISKVMVFDVENRFIAYSNTFRETVKDVFSCWGRLFVLTNESTLYRLTEASMSAKLDMFYAKTNFALAVSVAQSQGLDEATIAEIHRRFGDQYYNAGDHEGAMNQYIQTIGSLQPSYVIRKYLDAQRIQSLVIYLQELHSRGLANSDHTTLLLNAYTKMKDVARLDAFIKAESHGDKRKGAGAPDAGRELPFDLETVIRVCRQAGYFDHAVYLARKYERHDDYLRIQIEDAGKYRDALDYLRKLGPTVTDKPQSESNLGRYGRVLLEKLPEETTQLLVDICTGSGFAPQTAEKEDADAEAKAAQAAAAAAGTGGPSYLSYLAYPRSNTLGPGTDAASTAPSTIKEKEKSNPSSGPPEPAHKKRASTAKPASVYSGSRGSSPGPRDAANGTGRLKLEPRKPSPRAYFVHFVDHPEHFVRFLEAVASARWGQKVDATSATAGKKGITVSAANADLLPADAELDKADRMAVWNTLIELYLTLSGLYLNRSPPDAERSKTMQAKVQQVLKSGYEYDSTHALLVCSTRQFTEGLVLLWEKLGMYEDILRFWMDKEIAMAASPDGGDAKVSTRPSVEVLKHLNRYGESNPQLYPLVLRFLTSTPVLLQRHTTELSTILEHIEQEKIMPPLAVVQVLSRNGVASVGLVKQWLMRRITESKNEIDSDRRLIDSYRSETASKLKEIAELSDPDAPRVFHVTKCSACHTPLELPIVHFMCKHSYHGGRCLPDNETECPVCARQHSVIRKLRRDNERLADQHEVFLDDVEENGFSAIATAFSQGILNPPRGDEGLLPT